MREQAVPLLAEHGIRVVDSGPSLVDEAKPSARG
jgi:hypothetical protein